MPQHDAHIAATHDARRLNVDIAARAQNRTADQARERRNAADADGDHHVGQAAAQQRDHDQGKQYSWKGQHHVHQAHDDRLDAAAIVAGWQTQPETHQAGDTNRDEADAQRNSRAVNHSPEDVAAEVVRAHGVRRSRRL